MLYVNSTIDTENNRRAGLYYTWPLYSSVPARILTKPQPVAVLEGETIELVVSIEGFPQPTVEWSANRHILAVDRHQISITSETVTLTIPSSQVTDTAVYILTIQNETGSDSCSVDVTVTRRKCLDFGSALKLRIYLLNVHYTFSS